MPSSRLRASTKSLLARVFTPIPILTLANAAAARHAPVVPAASPEHDPSLSMERCFTLLADFLLAHRESITRSWIDGVLHHAGIPSARSLTFQQLSDHLPKLFDDMEAALRAESLDKQLPNEEILSDAEKHGAHRWEQGFHLDELLRELNIIRMLVMRDGLEAFRHACPGCRPALDRARDVIIAFFEETTIGSVEQYMREQQGHLESLNEELSRVDSMRLRLIGTVAHELGNSVYSLKMIMQALGKPEADAAAERARALALSEGAFSEIQTFLTQLTDYAALLSQPAVEWETVDLLDFAREIDGAFAPAASAAGLRFAVRIGEGLKAVRSERLKLKQIAANLITNAIKFRRPDGNDGEVSIAFEPDGADRWTIAVSDRGIGIAPADRSRIFEEFARLGSDVDAPGAGLGLSITRRLVEALGGTMEVADREGGGCQFTVRLPLHPEP